MALIDKISFDFSTQDEDFARHLYVDWDEFCRRCVTDVLNTFFTQYDTKNTYVEIDHLDLELGTLPQDVFYELFPIRLSEVLERCFTQKMIEMGMWRALSQKADSDMSNIIDETSVHVYKKREENLFHYLEYGFSLPEWEYHEFDLYEELSHFHVKGDVERLLLLFVSKPYVLERLLLQVDDPRLMKVLPIAAGLVSSFLGQYEKQWFLSVILEYSPQVIIHFIHSEKAIGNVEAVANLLENPHVKRMMVAETEHHAEVDLPEYWYRLYGWLLEYYPFNGVPMFGDKLHFRKYLNQRLLSFIRKRDQQAYLSKVDLTRLFLLEIFGKDYYLTVLSIIYHNQQLNVDGSPATGDSYVWDIYHTLLQLSLIEEQGYVAKNDSDMQFTVDWQNNISISTEKNAESVQSELFFVQWLEDNITSSNIKRMMLLKLVQEQPELLMRWVRSRPNRKCLLLLASLTDEQILQSLSGYVSLQLAEVVSVFLNVLGTSSFSVSWLQNISEETFRKHLNFVILEGISTDVFSSNPISVQLLYIAQSLHEEIIGSDSIEFTDVHDASRNVNELYELIINSMQYNLESKRQLEKDPLAVESIDVLNAILLDDSLQEAQKKLFMLQLFDVCHNKEKELILTLQKARLLETVINLLDDVTLRRISIRLMMQVYGWGQSLNIGVPIIQIIRLMVDCVDEIAGYISAPIKTVWYRLFISIASWHNTDISTRDVGQIVVELLSTIVGDYKNLVRKVVDLLVEKLLPFEATSENDKDYCDFNKVNVALSMANKALLISLIQIRQHINSLFISSDNLKAEEIFEQPLGNNSFVNLVNWLESNDITLLQKRGLIERYAVDNPGKMFGLLRDAIVSDEKTVNLFEKYISQKNIVWLIEKVMPALSGKLSKFIDATYNVGIPLFHDDNVIREKNVTKTLLLILADSHLDLNGISVENFTRLFLQVLHYVLTGKKEYTSAQRGQREDIERQLLSAIKCDNEIEKRKSDASDSFGNHHPLLIKESTEGVDVQLFDEWIEWLMSPVVSDAAKRHLLRHYARWQPNLLWQLVRHSSVSDSRRHISFEHWSAWLSAGDWLEMISTVSFSLAENLRQAVKSVSEKFDMSELIITEGLVRFVNAHSVSSIYHQRYSTLVKEYLEITCSLFQEKEYTKIVHDSLIMSADDIQSAYKENGTCLQYDQWSSEVQQFVQTVSTDVRDELHIFDMERIQEKSLEPEYIEVSNAGLCLLTLWLPRLFEMLNLISFNAEGNKDFKDLESRIRAIFILQRLVTDEKLEYKEQDLAFNRVLTACPFYVPLPRKVMLTEYETQTVESMLLGVKENWRQLKNTSVKGFQRSFIERPGKLEIHEDIWVLYVENRAYDLLLDALPWSYKEIRLPWLKKKIKVVWRDQKDFGIEHLGYKE